MTDTINIDSPEFKAFKLQIAKALMAHSFASPPPAPPDMTLRDYFAAKAMHASLSLDPANAASSEDHARWAYEMADAMLRARGVQ